jgi:hypothetical protein
MTAPAARYQERDSHTVGQRSRDDQPYMATSRLSAPGNVSKTRPCIPGGTIACWMAWKNRRPWRRRAPATKMGHERERGGAARQRAEDREASAHQADARQYRYDSAPEAAQSPRVSPPIAGRGHEADCIQASRTRRPGIPGSRRRGRARRPEPRKSGGSRMRAIRRARPGQRAT